MINELVRVGSHGDDDGRTGGRTERSNTRPDRPTNQDMVGGGGTGETVSQASNMLTRYGTI